MSKRVFLYIFLILLFMLSFFGDNYGARAEEIILDGKDAAASFRFDSKESITKNSLILKNVSSVKGIVGDALLFNGKNSSVKLNDFSLKKKSGITLSVWVQLNSSFSVDYRYITGKPGWPTPYAIIAEWNSRNPVCFTICSEGKRYSLRGGKLDDLYWHYVVGTYDQREGRLALYIDGVQVASEFKGHFPIEDDVKKPFIIGGLGGKHVFPGIIDECQIYDYALTAKDIQKKFKTITGAFLEKNSSIKYLKFRKKIQSQSKKLAKKTCTSPQDKYWKDYIQNEIRTLEIILKKQESKNQALLNFSENEKFGNRFADKLKRTSKLINAFGKKQLRNKNAIVYVINNPVMNKQILPKTINVPGNISNKIQSIATPGEYEPASIVISAINDLHNVKVVISDLKDKQGNYIPSSNIDAKVVKCWYQSGSPGGSTPVDEGEKLLTSELLLNDDSLVKVDTENKKNYLKYYDEENGKNCYADMSTTNFELDIKTIKKLNLYLKDSDKLLSVNISKGTNKQFWLTFLAPKNAKPGIYNGKLKLLADSGLLAELEVQFRILPFRLVEPFTHYNSQRRFVSSMYYWGELADDDLGDLSGRVRSEKQFRAELKNMFDHGITNPFIMWSSRLLYRNEKLLRKLLEIRKELGIQGPLYISEGRDVIGANDKAGIKRFRQKVKKVLDIAKEYGINDVYIYGIDEATGAVLTNQKAVWKAIRKIGAKVFVSGYIGSNFEEVGDIQDLLVCAGPPSKTEAKKWHSKGQQIFCYANPQGGMEAPENYRRNYGILLWKANYDGACTFCYMDHWHGFPWNDFSSPLAPPNKHRPHCMAYPTSEGVVDTLQLEGYREGIDDIKYACTLRSLIIKSKKSGNRILIQKAKKAEQYLNMLDGNGNLGLIRLNIINYILTLIDKRHKLKFIPDAPKTKVMIKLAPVKSKKKKTRGIIGAWNFDDGHGEVAKDSSGYGNDAIIVGAKWEKYKSGYGLFFDGKGNFLEVTNSEAFNFGTSDFAISFWVKSDPKVSSVYGDIISKYCLEYRGIRPAKGYQITLRSIRGKDKIRFNIAGSMVRSSRGIKDNKWHYVVCSRDKDKMSIFIDGKLDNSIASKSLSASSDEYLVIGHESFSPLGVRHFPGSLDDVKIYNHALSPQVILKNFEKQQSTYR